MSTPGNRALLPRHGPSVNQPLHRRSGFLNTGRRGGQRVAVVVVVDGQGVTTVQELIAGHDDAVKFDVAPPQLLQLVLCLLIVGYHRLPDGVSGGGVELD